MLKRTIKMMGAIVFLAGRWVVRIVQRIAGQHPAPVFTILYYHAVPRCDRGRFERQMTRASKGWRVVPANYTGPFDSGGRYLAITFDDAFESVCENAIPSLRQLGMPYTVFVPTGCLGRSPEWSMEEDCPGRNERVMSNEQLHSLSGGGCTLGSHTVSHVRLTACDDKTLRHELSAALETVKQWPNGVNELACPYGAVDDRVVRTALEIGYSRVYSIRPSNISRAPGAEVRGRTAIDAHDLMIEFILKAHGGYVWTHQMLGRMRGGYG